MKLLQMFINWFIGWLFEDKQDAVVCEVVDNKVFDVDNPKVHINLEERAKRFKAQIKQHPNITWKEFTRNNQIVNNYFMKGGEH